MVIISLYVWLGGQINEGDGGRLALNKVLVSERPIKIKWFYFSVRENLSGRRPLSLMKASRADTNTRCLTSGVMASDGCALYVDVYGSAAAFRRRLSAKTQNIDLMEGKLSENLFLTEANCIAHILRYSWVWRAREDLDLTFQRSSSLASVNFKSDE